MPFGILVILVLVLLFLIIEMLMINPAVAAADYFEFDFLIVVV
jgi:hypothetical protein